ncbi:MAG: response regulator [Microbacteriaceae bacterium]|nr:response regulator [Microbacteriaceae bacterium]
MSESPLGFAVVVDDEPLICGIIAEILEAEGWVVTQAGDALSAITAVKSTSATLVIADIDLGMGPTGIDVVQRARAENPSIGVVFITNLTDPRITGKGWDTIPRDASYIIKTEISSTSALRAAVTEALDARTATTRPLAAETATQSLSNTQVGVLKLVSEGLTNDEIATARATTVRAVERLLSRMMVAANIAPGPSARVQLARLYWDELNGR